METESDEMNEKKLAGIVLSSDSTMQIVKSLMNDDKRFSELQKELKMTSGRLNYHLLKLKSVGLLSRRRPKRYSLSKRGKRITKKYVL